MPNQVMTVHFTITVQKHRPQFVIPAHVRSAFGWPVSGREQVGLLIFSEDGECRFCGPKTMMSGPEIYGVDIGACVSPGERIHVYAFQYPQGA